MSAGQLSNLLIKDHQIFHTEKQEVYQAGLVSTPWQHLDQTCARVGGKNQTCQVVCNPFYTVYHTTQKKDRLTVLDVLQGGLPRQFLLNAQALKLMKTFNLPEKIIATLQQLHQDNQVGEVCFLEQLHSYLPKLGKIQLSRVLEAGAIAAYHTQTDWPVVQALVCDDAPQFKLLTFELALCWVHEGRHYKKLTPAVAYHCQILDTFLDRYWNYYHQLLEYRKQPSWVEASAITTTVPGVVYPYGGVLGTR